jgi:uncharacterized membrane protein
MLGNCAQLLATIDTLNERIGDFADLVGLVLVLVTLFTQQRNSRIASLEEGVSEKREWNTEVALNVVLFLVTLGLFVVGLPIVFECVRSFHPRSDAGPLRGAFVIVWALLVALMIWQISLVCAAWGKRKKWIDEHRTTSTGNEG